MTARPAQLLVLAKAPVAGRVKTRLSPPFTPAQAAELAAASLADTLTAVAAADVERRVLVLDGDPARVAVPSGVEVAAQSRGGLDRRIEQAVLAAQRRLAVPVLLVGMDTPQVATADLDAAVAELLAPGVDAVLGPAADGGFWSLGLTRPRPGLVRGVPMSRADTMDRQLAVLARHGLRTRLLPVVRDVDDADDAARVASEAPASRFAACLRDLVRGAA